MLNRIYWGCWILGAGLILLSRSGVVSANIGWAGFWVACAAALLSRIPRRAQSPELTDWVHLTDAMLESKDHAYERAMACLDAGGTVVCDGGLSFAMRPADDVELVAIASFPIDQMNDGRAIVDAERAVARIESVALRSPEIAGVASCRRIRVLLVSEFSSKGVEICQVAEGHVEWCHEHNAGTGQ